MRRAWAIVFGVVLLGGSVWLASRFLGTPTPQRGVVAFRLDRVGPQLVGRPRRSRKVKLAQSTRSAIETRAGDSFEIEVAADSHGVLFSIGTGGKGDAAARFVLSLRTKDGWEVLFDEELATTETGWHDRVVRLPPGGSAARKLRFRTLGPVAAVKSTQQAYWGSVTVLHPFSTPPPSVVLISLDTLSADHLSSFGNAPGVSPHIDDFLSRSFSFRRTYVQYPNTMYSHASLFTGLYPRHHAMYDGGRRRYVALDSLASVLAQRGYLTAAITEDGWVSSGFGFDHGFDHYYDGPRGFTSDAADTFDKARVWLDRFAGLAPFFLFVHTYQVHIPYKVPDRESRRVVEEISPNYEGPFVDFYGGLKEEGPHNSGLVRLAARDVKRISALYAAEINYLDRVVGRFLDDLGDLAGTEDVLVILTADHGEEFDEHGKVGHAETLYNPALHVPLAFHWPGHIEPASTTAVVQLIDVMPTVLDLLGIPFPPGVDGRSLAPVLRDSAFQLPPRPAFAELRNAPGECLKLHRRSDCRLDLYSVQTDRSKLIASNKLGVELLFDLRDDPQEVRDVHGGLPGERRRLRSLLDRYVAGSLPASAARNATPAMDATTKDKLRALGYLQ